MIPSSPIGGRVRVGPDVRAVRDRSMVTGLADGATDGATDRATVRVVPVPVPAGR